VVLQAAQYYPFKRVIGVEFSPELNRIARQNLQARQDRLRCPDVELVTGDVAEQSREVKDRAGLSRGYRRTAC
jgi:predicted RNA methylase